MQPETRLATQAALDAHRLAQRDHELQPAPGSPAAELPTRAALHNSRTAESLTATAVAALAKEQLTEDSSHLVNLLSWHTAWAVEMAIDSLHALAAIEHAAAAEAAEALLS